MPHGEQSSSASSNLHQEYATTVVRSNEQLFGRRLASAPFEALTLPRRLFENA
jgi:hypothetical protein